MEMAHSRSCTSHEVQSDQLHELVSVPGANEVLEIQYEIFDCYWEMIERYENCEDAVFKESVRLRSSLEETNKIISRFTEILGMEMTHSRSCTSHEVQSDQLHELVSVPGANEALEIQYEIRDHCLKMIERYENCEDAVFKESVHLRSSLEETNKIISRSTEISDVEMNHSRDGTDHGVQSDWLHRLVSVPRVNEILQKQFEIRDRCLEMIACYENCEDKLLQEVAVCARFCLEVTNKIISKFA